MDSSALRSKIDYVIVNQKIAPKIMDTHVHRGPNIDTDHCLVISKIAIWVKWRRHTKPWSKNKEQDFVYNVELLPDASTLHLYRTRLTQGNSSKNYKRQYRDRMGKYTANSQ